MARSWKHYPITGKTTVTVDGKTTILGNYATWKEAGRAIDAWLKKQGMPAM